MPQYRVVWEIQVEAEDEVEAGYKALHLQREKEAKITSFEVTNLEEEETVAIEIFG
jgi:hypothetical protein